MALFHLVYFSDVLGVQTQRHHAGLTVDEGAGALTGLDGHFLRDGQGEGGEGVLLRCNGKGKQQHQQDADHSFHGNRPPLYLHITSCRRRCQFRM